MSLQAGQVIRYDNALWRVDHCNASRARIIPLAKRVVTLDDRTFEAERGGVNISPNSFVEIVTDLDEARTRLELEVVEAELAAAKAEMRAQDRLKQELQEAERELAAAKAEFAAAPKTGTGWRWVGPATFKPGSMGETVSRYIEAHPGLTTAEIVAAAPAPGAVAACVSRFNQAGLIIRS